MTDGMNQARAGTNLTTDPAALAISSQLAPGSAMNAAPGPVPASGMSTPSGRSAG